MTSTAIALAFVSSFCDGAGLAPTQLGLRDLPPLSGAAISVPTATLMAAAGPRNTSRVAAIVVRPQEIDPIGVLIA